MSDAQIIVQKLWNYCNVLRDDVRSVSDEDLLAGVPRVPKGKKMEGQFFPLLYDPAG